MKPHQNYTGQLLVGQRVHCSLYGGRDGTIVEIEGTQSPENVQALSGGILSAGGKAYFSIVWEDGSTSPRIHEGLIRSSCQWKVYPEVAGADEVAKAIGMAASFKAQAKMQEEARAQAFRNAKAKAIEDNPHLQPIDPGGYSGPKLAAKNVRIELKQTWPSCKFSVRSTHSTLSISWVDGPTSEQVNDLAKKYQSGYYDSMQDMHVREASPFTEVFGNADYVNVSRQLSDDLLVAAYRALRTRLKGNFEGVGQHSLAAIKTWNSFKIPSLDLNINEAVNAVAHFWDDSTECYVRGTRFVHQSWLVWSCGGELLIPPLVRQQAAELALSGEVA